MRTAVCFIGVCLWAGALGQNTTDETVDLQRLTDELLGYPDHDDADYEVLYENLVQILSSPYDLNKVTREELQHLHILTDQQIASLLAYRKEQGKLLDIYELQVIPEFDFAVISKLLPFVKVTDPTSGINQSLLQRITSGGHGYVVTRYARTLETKKGFLRRDGHPPSFNGSADKIYWRMRTAIPGDFSVGITGEKDAGEMIAFDPQKHQWAFDFTSYHLQLQNKGKLKNLILGDFQAQIGQGLLLGSAFGLGKGAASVSTSRKSNLGFLPYTSIDESAYQRGVGVTVQPVEALKISSFYSRARRDASFEESSDTLSVTSFQETGYHRTKGELQKRKKVIEQNFGLVVQLRKTHLDAGVILHAIHFDVPVLRKPTLYNQHVFGGRQNLNTGIFLNYTLQNISFFGEAGRSLSGGNGVLAGLLLSAHSHLDVAILYRNYARNFHTFYSNAFSENTEPRNERGVYWGWKYRWNRKYSFTGYLDLFTFPWLGFRRYAPSNGYEWLLRGNYQPSKKVSLFVQFREEFKYRNTAESLNLYRLKGGKKRNLAIHCDYGIGEKIRLKSRMQYNHYVFDQSTTEGIALLQDISFSVGRFNFTGRHAVFETDHYDNRHYVYEHDAWLAYSLPAYSGIGVRNYALIEYKLHKRLTLWLRYARTGLLHTGEIGSGQDVIEGNTRNDVKFQVRLKF